MCIIVAPFFRSHQYLFVVGSKVIEVVTGDVCYLKRITLFPYLQIRQHNSNVSLRENLIIKYEHFDCVFTLKVEILKLIKTLVLVDQRPNCSFNF